MGYIFTMQRYNSRESPFERNDAQALLLLIKLQRGNLTRYNTREARILIRGKLDNLIIDMSNNVLSKNSILYGQLSRESVNRLEQMNRRLISAKNSLPSVDENWTDRDLSNLLDTLVDSKLGISDARRNLVRTNNRIEEGIEEDSNFRDSEEYRELLNLRRMSRYRVFTENCKVLSSTALDDILNRDQICRNREGASDPPQQQGRGN